MELVQVVGWVNLVAYVALAAVALREWRRGKTRAARWAVVAFGALAAVLVGSRLLPDDPGVLLERTLGRALIVALLLFPYLLYRFSSSFRPANARVDLALASMTALIAVWTFAAPSFPEAGEPRQGWFVAYLLAFLAHWAIFSVVVAVRLWRAGRGQPSVARRRMRLLGAAAAVLTVALFSTVVAGGASEGFRVASGLLATLGAVLFLLALSPPWLVRAAWRRPEQERLRTTVGELMLATSEEDVAARVLGPMREVVGARALALYTADGRLVGTHGVDLEWLPRLEREGPEALGGSLDRIEFEGGALLVWASPYAPYFGGDELTLLRSLADLTGIALDRSRLFAQEREARAALEQADEIKSNFIALAAHELRTPVAAVHGVAETLHARGPELHESQRVELRAVLLSQSMRLRLLVEQLLDLSRLDAHAITIDARPLLVRERVVDVVAAAAVAEEIEVAVPADLEAMLDPSVFERIVTNLVVNATRYGAPPIRVSAELRDRHFRLTVEDRGPGVPPELVPELFERFTRGSDARAGGIGTGLGLAIARSYAQAHRGDLLYEPALPHGARFQLVLPVEPDEAEAHVLARSRPPRVPV